MQNNEKKPAFPARNREIILFFLRLLTLVLLSWFVVQALRQRHTGLLEIARHLGSSLRPETLGWLLLTLLLTPLNWSLEALKWRDLARKIQPVRFRDALEGVLAGLSFGFATPANLGDYAGRLLNLNTNRRLENLGAALLGNGAQYLVTLLGGTLGYAYFQAAHVATLHPGHRLLLGVMVLSLGFGMWVGLRRETALNWLARCRWLAPVSRSLRVIGQYRAGELARVLCWASLRYAVFSLQFLLILYVFGVRLHLPDLLSSVALVFFAKTVLPSFHFLSDLGIREFTALYCFSFFPVEPAAIISATLTLWVINILVPVLVGTVFLLRLKRRPSPPVVASMSSH
ncbi:MAG: flippase-like domain-containing protein [Sphingobacteriaceae bacterium]|nr:flippase-like domain-containing protein [Cytophagaceae bacterium]